MRLLQAEVGKTMAHWPQVLALVPVNKSFLETQPYPFTSTWSMTVSNITIGLSN